MRCRSVACGMASQTQSATRSIAAAQRHDPHAAANYPMPATQKRAPTKPVTRELGLSKFAKWVLCCCHIRVLAIENSIKEAISYENAKSVYKYSGDIHCANTCR